MTSYRAEMSVDPAQLRAVLDYDTRTGVLTWKRRTPDMFADGAVPPVDQCVVWNRRYAGKPALTRTRKGRGGKYGCVLDRVFQAHRVAWAIHYGSWPSSQIDHIDGSPWNNAIDNLRLADAETNARNRGLSRRNHSGVLGVRWCATHNRWVAHISDKNVRIALGSFITKAEACAARQAAERVLGYHRNHGKRLASGLRISVGGQVKHVVHGEAIAQ